MKKTAKILLFLMFCGFGSEVAFGVDSLSLLIPTPEDGWIKSEAMEIYNRQNLFDYIDGGAELYLAYDFKQLVVQKYIPQIRDSLPEESITVEIWQMNSSADAYGVYSLDREGERVTIGQGGVYGDGFLRFWKDVYFIKILQVGDISKETIFRLGRGIVQKIRKEGQLPLLVQKTPTDSLVANSICFFHKKIILNNLYHFSDQDMLNLSTETDCILADFRICDDHVKFLLIQYPDTTNARDVEKNLKEPYLTKGALASDKLFVSKEDGLIGMDLSRNYLVLVLGGKDKQNILWFLSTTKSSIEGGVKQLKPRCFRYR